MADGGGGHIDGVLRPVSVPAPARPAPLGQCPPDSLRHHRTLHITQVREGTLAW